MQQQMDLFNMLLEVKSIDKIRDQIDRMAIFDTIETQLCTVEKTNRFWVVKTSDFEQTFQDKKECLEFIERGSVCGWDFVYELQQ